MSCGCQKLLNALLAAEASIAAADKPGAKNILMQPAAPRNQLHQATSCTKRCINQPLLYLQRVPLSPRLDVCIQLCFLLLSKLGKLQNDAQGNRRQVTSFQLWWQSSACDPINCGRSIL